MKQFLLCFLALTLWNSRVYAQLERAEAYYEQREMEAKKELITLSFVQESQNLVSDYKKLKQIVLLRHGEPALDKKGWRKRKEAMQYIKDYDSVPVYPPKYIPLSIRDNEVNIIYTSTLNRSISTADQLFDDRFTKMADADFREFERKIFSFLNIKLPLGWWLNGSRVFWFMGLNKKGIERFSQAKSRARKNAEFLAVKGMDRGKVLLVSHGLLNHFLVRYLKKEGWTELYDGGKGYLSQKLLVKYVE